MSDASLRETARAMVAPEKGILAVDETVATCTRRFEQFGIESTAESRRDYRALFFTAPGASRYIAAAILVDETLRQTTAQGEPLVGLVAGAGIIPGVKVDAGARPLAGAPGETVTEGLDRLRERCEEYRALGARFTKWRAVIRIGPGLPSSYCLRANAHALARYAAIAQEAGLVPIVEPEVLMDGDHGIERCREATEATLHAVFEELVAQHCLLEGIVLKPNMVTAGASSGRPMDADEVAERTLEALRRCVPAAVPGVAFLSGGQSGEEACANLNAMARRGPHPWELSFSFGRALQYPALEIWGGRPENVAAAQAAFLHRARMASLARSGRYSPELEKEAVRS